MASYHELIIIFVILLAFFSSWVGLSSAGIARSQNNKTQASAKPQTSFAKLSNNHQASRANELAALGYITWWSLDAGGYHPCILVKIQNVSGKDLSDQRIRFQARFTDLRFGSITVGRADVHQEFGNQKVIYVLLKATRAFELSQNTNEWPMLECKVMSRVGDVGDEGTQTLLITKVDTITMSDEDAFYKINRMNDVRQSLPK